MDLKQFEKELTKEVATFEKMPSTKIILKNISQNNLKNISLEIPKNKLIVVTGVSGSGKSSLAFDVINKEGQRRFFSHFSAQSRKYLGKLEKAEVESITNLNPTVSLSQKTKNNNPRSTVGTISGIYDYLRLLFARVGESRLKNLEINRSLFSFNSLTGACPHCKGLGVEDVISPELLIEDETKSIRNQALKITNPNGYTIYSQVTIDALNQVCEAHGFNVDIPWRELTDEQRNIVLNGSDKIKILYGKHSLESRMKWSGITAKPREKSIYKGILPVMNEILNRDRNPNILRFAKTQKCSVCQGNRLSAEALSVQINEKNISELSNFNLNELDDFLRKSGKKEKYAKNKVFTEIADTIFKKLETLNNLGLNYLSLSRKAESLSGGESQRLRLARQLNSGLQNIIYVFDEPSIGVHLANNYNILKIIRKLVNHGNTAIVVEHDAQTILSADWIIDIGPKAGIHGGEILFNGSLQDFLNSKHQSFTKDYLNKNKQINLNFKPSSEADYFTVKNAEINNLKKLNVNFRKNALNVVCGVSGAGKSSLVNRTLIPLYRNGYNKQINAKGEPELENFDFKKVIIADQSPIGKTVRSTPATYTKLHDLIRNLYAELEDSKKQKFTKSTFSFNTKSGSCKKCGGAGTLEIGMHFLGNVETICDKCNGKRYNPEVLEVKYKGKSISDVLDLSVNQAFDFFTEERKILKSLLVLKKIGLGYLKLGQSSNTLSGGEAQRIKLATELIKANSGNMLFIFDEPSTGLHFADIQVLLDFFADLLKKGNTIIVIEHNEDFIRNANHIIELGSKSAQSGGELLFEGNFSGFSKSKTITSKALIKLETFLESSNNKNFSVADRNRGSRTSTSLEPNNKITFKGISTNNLKNIDVEIPYNKHTVIVGKSGSGKSSLAFDTIFAEAQNRFTENFPMAAQQLSRINSNANYEQVTGLTPSLALRQNQKVNDPRSTLATLTEIYDLYRLLFSRFGCDTQSHVEKKEQDSIRNEANTKKVNKLKTNKINTKLASAFSFNNSDGACTKCSGLGKVLTSSPKKLIANYDLPFGEGALVKNRAIRFYSDKNGQFYATLLAVGKKYGFDYTQAVKDISAEALRIAFSGSGDEEYEVNWQFKGKTTKGRHSFTGKWKGFTALILEDYYRKHANGKGQDILEFLYEKECPECKGQKYKPEILNVKIRNINIFELSRKSVKESLIFFNNLNSEDFDKLLIENIVSKLSALDHFGLSYLTLNRFSKTLSGGELQRVLLSTQINNSLTGLTYILDEPSTGLHVSEIDALAKNIQRLTESGNTIVTVEHNPEIIKSADQIIEIGPEAGQNGGEITGIYKNREIQIYLENNFKNNIGSLYFGTNISTDHQVGRTKIPIFLQISSAKANNLKNINVKFSINAVNAVTGVSGSGKTTLLRDVLYQTFVEKEPQFCESIKNLNQFDNLVWIDRNLLETNKISTPVTFLGIFDEIRKLFAQTPSAKAKKLKAGDFSYNGKSGQCTDCNGKGFIRHSLDFMNDVTVHCETCGGKRYKKPVLEVLYKGKSIFEILEMSISEAFEFFKGNKKLYSVFEILVKFGLAYIKLGQNSTELSGAENQRFKIAKSLIKSSKGKTLYIFDEASRGLHYSDLQYLIAVFRLLRKQNNTVIAIEHNPVIVSKSDWIVDLGKSGSKAGGELVYQGNLSGLINCEDSKIGQYFLSNNCY